MKIELRKETRKNGNIWFCLYLDNIYHTSYISLEDANKEYERLKAEAVYEEVVEVLKSEEI